MHQAQGTLHVAVAAVFNNSSVEHERFYEILLTYSLSGFSLPPDVHSCPYTTTTLMTMEPWTLYTCSCYISQ